MAGMVIISREGTTEGDEWARQVAHSAAAEGLDVLLTPNLYHVAEDDAIWARLREIGGPTVAVMPLHARAGEWLLRKHGVGAGGLTVVSSWTVASPAEALAEVLKTAGSSKAPAPGRVTELQAEAGTRWYPVLDYSRCQGCRHCFQFCLFGVYTVDEARRVQATQPDNCKAGCPACSRICPQSAIMFPLYRDDEAIRGAPGKFVSLDDEARRMYYTRTEATCPVCGQSGPVPRRRAKEAQRCAECGRAVVAAETAESEQKSDTLDEIDALISELESVTGRRQ